MGALRAHRIALVWGWQAIYIEVQITSKKVQLKQNLIHELMVMSVWPCVVRNFAKFAEKKYQSENFAKKKF